MILKDAMISLGIPVVSLMSDTIVCICVWKISEYLLKFIHIIGIIVIDRI